MKGTFKNTSSYPRKIHIGLQGGGSLGAFTAGVLDQILSNPTLEIKKISGTSAGAMNGMVITQTINKYGFDLKGRTRARRRLKNFWNDIAHPNFDPFTKVFLAFAGAANPLVRNAFVNNSLIHHIQRYIKNPNALKSGKHISLTINAVSDDGETLFIDEDITKEALRASAAIQPYIASVMIDGKSYRDGAYIGGSNPPLDPLLENSEACDAIILIMTNPPELPIHLRHQKDLSKSDVVETEDLILHQVYDHIALLLSQRDHGATIPPIHVIWPNISQPFTQDQKQRADRNFIESLYTHGQEVGAEFLSIHDKTLHIKSSISLKSLRRKALRYANPFSNVA